MAQKETLSTQLEQFSDVGDEESNSTPASVPRDDEAFIHEIVELFTQQEAAWNDIRASMLDDLKFFNDLADDQQYLRQQRSKTNKPIVKANTLPPMLQAIEADMRKRNISIDYNPTDELGSVETSEVLRGIQRRINRVSNLPSVLIQAMGRNGMLVPGMGFVKVDTEYVSNATFDQDVVIKQQKDPFKIMPDISFEMPDASDASFWFEFEDLNRKQFEKAYPKSILNTGTTFQPKGAAIKNTWVAEHQVRVAKYWYRDKKEYTLYLFEDGSTANSTDPYEATDENGDVIVDEAGVSMMIERPPVLDQRQVFDYVVKWVVTNGVEILDEGEWHNAYFPWVAFIANDVIVDGKRLIHGAIRYAKDSQKIYSYIATDTIEKLGAANKTPWLIDINAVPEKLQQYYEQSNIDEMAVLWWQSSNGANPANKPERIDTIEPAVNSLLGVSMKTKEDIKACLGFYDPMGFTSSGRIDPASGVALQTAAQQGEQSNLYFMDNAVTSIRRVGFLCLNLIPIVYDTARTVAIIGADDESEIIKINQIFQRGKKEVYYNLTAGGAYDVTVDTGPSYATKQSQDGAMCLELMKVLPPNFVPAVADIAAGSLDIEKAQLFVDRIRQVQANDMPYLNTGSNDEMDDVPPEVKAKVIQLINQNKKLDEMLQRTFAEYQEEKYKNDTSQVKAASDEKIQMMKLYETMEKERMDLTQQIQASESEAQLTLLRSELDSKTEILKIILKSVHETEKKARDRSGDAAKLLKQIAPSDTTLAE